MHDCSSVYQLDTQSTNNKNEEAPVDDLQSAYRQHIQRRDAIKQSKRLIKLVLELQKHRGCTLAILSGDHFFASQLHGIQREITQLFRDIQQQQHGNQLVDHTGILQEWIVLRQHWPKDEPHENFLHHSNLIARLLTHIWQTCGETLQQDLDAPQQQLARFFLKDWLDMIETCAQARGLATHSAVLGSLSNEIHARIRFLNTQMQALDRGLAQLLPTLLEAHQRKLELRIDNTDYHQHLSDFLRTTQQGLEARKLDDADLLYRLGSQSVSACQQVLWCALQLLEHCMPQDLQRWISGQQTGPSLSGTPAIEDQEKPSKTILPMVAPASKS